VAAVACDPGGVNALAPVVRALEGLGTEVWIGTSDLAGDIWDAAGTKATPTRRRDDATLESAKSDLRDRARADLLLSGAGAFNQLEHTFRLAARHAGLPCVAILDDRGRYRERFGRVSPDGWVDSTPGRICIMDDETRDEMNAQGYDRAALCVTGQPHLEEVQRFFTSLSRGEIELRRKAAGVVPGEQVIAFFSEPLAEALEGDTSATAQLRALSYLGNVVQRVPRRPTGSLHLVVKPHPREDPEPLRWSVRGLKHQDVRARIEGGNSLDLIALADVVVGIFSMVLFEARLAGRPAISIQIGHDRTDRWWGGRDAGIHVATNPDDLKMMLADTLAERPAPPSRSRFQGATERVIGVLASVANGVPASNSEG
jgi:hypothetical protein